jgi:hypothetical protein
MNMDLTISVRLPVLVPAAVDPDLVLAQSTSMLMLTELSP